MVQGRTQSHGQTTQPPKPRRNRDLTPTRNLSLPLLLLLFLLRKFAFRFLYKTQLLPLPHLASSKFSRYRKKASGTDSFWAKGRARKPQKVGSPPRLRATWTLVIISPSPWKPGTRKTSGKGRRNWQTWRPRRIFKGNVGPQIRVKFAVEVAIRNRQLAPKVRRVKVALVFRTVSQSRHRLHSRQRPAHRLQSVHQLVPGF